METCEVGNNIWNGKIEIELKNRERIINIKDNHSLFETLFLSEKSNGKSKLLII